MKKLILTSSFLLLTSYFAPAASETNAPAPFQVLTRGMAVKGIDSALAAAKVGSTAALLWSQDSIVISTFPKP